MSGRLAEPWLGPLVGGITGLITAATGVFVIPAVPYLQAIGLEKDDLVQALGLSFTVSTLALAVNLAMAGTFNLSLAGPSIGTLAMAAAGMWLGQELRTRLSPATFRVWFFVALLLLGLYLLCARRCDGSRIGVACATRAPARRHLPRTWQGRFSCRSDTRRRLACSAALYSGRKSTILYNSIKRAGVGCRATLTEQCRDEGPSSTAGHRHFGGRHEPR